MKKKVFISIGMSGRNTEDVLKDIEQAIDRIHTTYGYDVEIIHNFDCVGPINAGRLWYLGEAIKKLGDCDVCYFTIDWKRHKGCVVEFVICKLYGIDIIRENCTSLYRIL